MTAQRIHTSNFTPPTAENYAIDYQVVLKPSINLSWIPLGRTTFTPNILATYIPSENNPERFAADLLRAVAKTEKVIGDTSRQITIKAYADLLRRVASTGKTNVDTCRNVAVAEKVFADLKRQVAQTGNVTADLLRRVTATETFVGDTLRQVTTASLEVSTVYADLLRKIAKTEQPSADTMRSIGVKEKVSSDVVRIIAQRNSARADTLLRTGTTEKLAAELLLRLRHFARGNTERKISRRYRRKADTIIRVPHILKYCPQRRDTLRVTKARNNVKVKTAGRLSSFADAPGGYNPFGDDDASIVNTFGYYGVTRATVTLNERTLSDTFEIEFANNEDVNVPEMDSTVQFRLLDYEFEFAVTERVVTKETTIIKGQYVLDRKFDLDTEEKTAQDILKGIADKQGWELDAQFDNFTPANFDKIKSMTYGEVLQHFFSWGSQVPTILVNVFIRGNKLYVIQRGAESDELDLTEKTEDDKPKYPIASERTTEKKLSRVQGDTDSIEEEDDEVVPFSGVISFSTLGGYISCSYSGGLLVKEELQNTGVNNSADNTPAGLSDTAHAQLLDEYKNANSGVKIQTSYTSYFYASHTHINSDTDNQGDIINTAQGAFTRTADDTFVKIGDATTDDTDDGGDTNLNIGTAEQITEYYLSTKQQTTRTENVEGDYYHTITQQSITNYFYHFAENDVYLFHERNITDTTDKYDYMYAIITNTIKSRVEKTKTQRDTYHFPAGNGFYVQVVYVDGEFQGGNISQGKPGNAVSLYTVNAVQQNFQSINVNSGMGASLRETTLGDLRKQINEIADKIAHGALSNMPIEERMQLERQIQRYEQDNTLAPYTIALKRLLTSDDGTGNVDLKKILTDSGVDASEFMDIPEDDIATGETVKLGGAFSVLTGDDDDSKALYAKCLQAKLALSGAIQATYTCDIVSKVKDGAPAVDHIIDFTDKILQGALVSNKITFTPKKLTQSLTLQSWY